MICRILISWPVVDLYINMFPPWSVFFIRTGGTIDILIFLTILSCISTVLVWAKKKEKHQVFFLHTNFLEKIICCTLVWELDTEFLVKLKDLEGLSVQACYMCLYIELKSPNSHAESTHRDLWCLELCTFWLRVISVQYRWRFLMSRAGIHV